MHEVHDLYNYLSFVFNNLLHACIAAIYAFIDESGYAPTNSLFRLSHFLETSRKKNALILLPLAASIISCKDIILWLLDPGFSKPGTKNPRPGLGDELWLRVRRLLRFWGLTGTTEFSDFEEVEGFGDESAMLINDAEYLMWNRYEINEASFASVKGKLPPLTKSLFGRTKWWQVVLRCKVAASTSACSPADMLLASHQGCLAASVAGKRACFLPVAF